MSRRAIAILSTENLLHNLQIIRNSAPNSKIMAMLKGNAFGHGLRSVASRLEKHVENLGVASIEDALALRKIGINSPITLTEGVFEADELLIASAQRFEVVFHDQSQINWLEASRLPLPLKIWIKVDTGMGRVGFSGEQVEIIHERLATNMQVLQPIGIMSHFACADKLDHPMNQIQMNAFHKFAHQLPGPKSFCNSSAIFHFPVAQYDVVRPGLALYGISPISGKSGADIHLKPVMTLKSRLVAVRKFKKGSCIGYESKFTCPEDMQVGVIAMGYGDGYPRLAQNGTPVLVDNIKCKIVGRVSMDMMSVDLRTAPHAQVGDPVVLWGNSLPLEEVASYTPKSPYDLITGIQQRVNFYWTMAAEPSQAKAITSSGMLVQESASETKILVSDEKSQN